MHRYKEIDLLRGIAIFLVILGHAIIVYPIDLHEIYWCAFLFSWISSVHMPLFFLISGFCYRFKQEQENADKQYRKYIWKKIKRLVIPYVVFCGISIAMKVLFPDLVNHKASVIDDIISIFLHGGGYWFLYTLFSIFLIFPVLERIYEKAPFAFTSLNIIFLYFWVCNVLLAKIDVFLLNNLCHYLPYFSIGFLFRKNIEKMEEIYRKIQRPVYAVIAAMIWLGCITIIEEVLQGSRLIDFVSSLMGIYCLVYLVSGIKKYRCRLLLCFSKYSLQLYLMNGYMLVISRIIAIKILHCSSAVGIIVFNMLIDCFLSLLIIQYVIDKNKITRLLGGIV